MKIHLTRKINLISSKDRDENQLMHSKRVNTETMIGNNRNEIVNLLLIINNPAKSIFNFASQYPTFSFNKNHETYTNITP